MTLKFEISAEIPGTPGVIYSHWLDSEGHTAMTGGPAETSDEVGGKFSAWGGYISGKNLALVPGEAIIQSWRTTEFTPSEEDSHLEIRFEATAAGTKITIVHTNLPDHGMQYKQGWVDNYFTPMVEFFANRG